jgi:ataxia telangiectasia mutated family protein
MTPKQARASLQSAEAQRKNSGMSLRKVNKKKEQIFGSILSQLKPVMRHFFFEKHRVPSLWFAMRLNYSRSVATSSIVGHIVGLGDRHGSNIIMDKIRGDVIQIDLGIAFEQACHPIVTFT